MTEESCQREWSDGRLKEVVMVTEMYVREITLGGEMRFSSLTVDTINSQDSVSTDICKDTKCSLLDEGYSATMFQMWTLISFYSSLFILIVYTLLPTKVE